MMDFPFKSSIQYVLIDNPICQQSFKITSSVLTTAASWLPVAKPKEVQQVATKAMPPMSQLAPLYKLAGGHINIVRLAGISGALAVWAGAYGAHSILKNEEIKEHRKRVFDTANRYHFFHSLALLGTPLCRYPTLSASFLLGGMILFIGPCYYMSVTDKENLRLLTPFGGVLLLIGWLSMVL